MSRGTVHQEIGWLNDRRGVLVLRRQDGGTWQLDCGLLTGWRARLLVGRRVAKTGVRDGFDLLGVKTIEAV